MLDREMRIVWETLGMSRPIARSRDLIVEERGPFNHHCAECGTLLIRDAGEHVPDVIVICPVCLSLNEVVPTGAVAGGDTTGARLDRSGPYRETPHREGTTLGASPVFMASAV